MREPAIGRRQGSPTQIRQQNLERANTIRSARGRLRCHLRAGGVAATRHILAELLVDPPAEL